MSYDSFHNSKKYDFPKPVQVTQQANETVAECFQRAIRMVTPVEVYKRHNGEQK